MIKQGFNIGERDWYVMAYYDIQTIGDLREVEEALTAARCRPQAIEAAIEVLTEPNTGYTFSNFDERLTLIFISRATSAAQMYDTIQHELKHATEHIGEYFHLDPKGERAAYLQGEIARQMFPAAALAVCPVCHCEEQ
jgi:hypothetical protein